MSMAGPITESEKAKFTRIFLSKDPVEKRQLHSQLSPEEHLKFLPWYERQNARLEQLALIKVREEALSRQREQIFSRAGQDIARELQTINLQPAVSSSAAAAVSAPVEYTPPKVVLSVPPPRRMPQPSPHVPDATVETLTDGLSQLTLDRRNAAATPAGASSAASYHTQGSSAAAAAATISTVSKPAAATSAAPKGLPSRMSKPPAPAAKLQLPPLTTVKLKPRATATNPTIPLSAATSSSTSSSASAGNIVMEGQSSKSFLIKAPAKPAISKASSKQTAAAAPVKSLPSEMSTVGPTITKEDRERFKIIFQTHPDERQQLIAQLSTLDQQKFRAWAIEQRAKVLLLAEAQRRQEELLRQQAEIEGRLSDLKSQKQQLFSEAGKAIARDLYQLRTPASAPNCSNPASAATAPTAVPVAPMTRKIPGK